MLPRVEGGGAGNALGRRVAAGSIRGKRLRLGGDRDKLLISGIPR
jgi:hypothetical protein